MTREEAIPVIDILISQYFVEAHNNGYLDYQRAEIIEALEMAKETLQKGSDNCTDEKQGEWVVCGDGERVPFMCTHCGKTTSWYHKQTAKYCPNCGARMKGEEI